MSDSTDNNSVITNLMNKVKYNIHKATYDPEANKFVDEQTTQPKQDDKPDNKIADTAESNKADTTQPNEFSIMRLFKKIVKQVLDIFTVGFIPFIALMLTMIVTNELIVYSAPIRIIFFIFTFLVCIFIPPFTILLGIYYIFKGGYSYYVNNMTDRPKTEIMPTIYALLPITLYKPLSSFTAALLYPFTYPKTEQAAEQLPKTMDNYWTSLKASFADFDRFKNLDPFAKNIQKIEENLKTLHSVNVPVAT